MSGYSPKAFCPYCKLNLYKTENNQRKCHNCQKQKGVESMTITYDGDMPVITQMVVLFKDNKYLISLNLVAGNWVVSETESVPQPKIIKVFNSGAKIITPLNVYEKLKTVLIFL